MSMNETKKEAYGMENAAGKENQPKETKKVVYIYTV